MVAVEVPVVERPHVVALIGDVAIQRGHGVQVGHTRAQLLPTRVITGLTANCHVVVRHSAVTGLRPAGLPDVECLPEKTAIATTTHRRRTGVFGGREAFLPPFTRADPEGVAETSGRMCSGRRKRTQIPGMGMSGTPRPRRSGHTQPRPEGRRAVPAAAGGRLDPQFGELLGAPGDRVPAGPPGKGASDHAPVVVATRADGPLRAVGIPALWGSACRRSSTTRTCPLSDWSRPPSRRRSPASGPTRRCYAARTSPGPCGRPGSASRCGRSLLRPGLARGDETPPGAWPPKGPSGAGRAGRRRPRARGWAAAGRG